MAAEDKLFKLQNLERTKQLINDISFTKAVQLPKAAGGETLTPETSSSQSFLLRRTQDLVNRHDMSAIEPHIKIFSAFDPANPYYSSLLNRINHGEHITWKEFEEAVSRFSSQEYYLTKLQDEINNTKINASLEGIPEEEIEDATKTEGAVAETPESPSSTETEQTMGEQPPSVGSALEPLQHPPRYVQPQAPALSQKGEEQLRQVNKSMQETKNKLAGENPPQLSQTAEQKLAKTNQSMQQTKQALNQPEAKPQISQSMENKLNRTSRSMRRPTTPTRSPLLNSSNRKKAAAALFRGGSSGGFGLPWVPKFLQRWAGNLARGAARLAWNIGSSLGRAAINALTRAAAQLLPRLATQAALQAGRSLLVAGAGAVISLAPLLLLITLIGGFLLFIYAMYDTESECGKAGTPELSKTVVNGQPDTDGETKFTIDQEIEYSIVVNFRLKCGGNLNAEVIDTLPADTEYVLGSSKSPTYAIQSQGGTSNMLSFESSQQDRTLVWNIKGLPNNRPFEIRFKVKPTKDNVWILNETTTRFTIFRAGVGGAGPGGRVIDSQSATFNEVVNEAAQNARMDPALLKAILKVEAGAVLEYSEEEFLRFSTPGWWEGADAASIKRGYAYNTCDDPTAGCGAGNDVRGVAQFELATWKGIVPQLQFTDGHEPDRRNARDAIFGSSVLNRRNAESYAGTSNVEWTEDVIRAMARMYCAGPAAGRNPELARHRACGWNGTRGYDDFVWDYYRQYSGQI